MAEDLLIPENISKKEKYELLIPQIEALIQGENDLTANLGNIAASLHHTFHWWWTGFYLVKDGQLVLGPFQGPVACTRILFGRGVCGSSWKQEKSILVPDVNLFPGHIACSSQSVAEIVVPLIVNGVVVAVLDIDSEMFDILDETDLYFLEKIARIAANLFKW
jgi:GAF domain-containing protein